MELLKEKQTERRRERKKVGSDFASDSKFWQKFQEGRKRRFKNETGPEIRRKRKEKKSQKFFFSAPILSFQNKQTT